MSYSTEPFATTRQPVRGPREPLPRLASTAPPAGGFRRAIPLEKFHDVLLDPEGYSEKYPEILPLTRRLYKQVGALQTSGTFRRRNEPTRRVPRDRKQHEEHARASLETTTQTQLARRDSSLQKNAERKRQPRSFLDMSDEIFGTTSQTSQSNNNIYRTPVQDHNARKRSDLDLMERGEWEDPPHLSVVWTVNVGSGKGVLFEASSMSCCHRSTIPTTLPYVTEDRITQLCPGISASFDRSEANVPYSRAYPTSCQSTC